jgi:hypothetical protein
MIPESQARKQGRVSSGTCPHQISGRWSLLCQNRTQQPGPGQWSYVHFPGTSHKTHSMKIKDPKLCICRDSDQQYRIQSTAYPAVEAWGACARQIGGSQTHSSRQGSAGSPLPGVQLRSGAERPLLTREYSCSRD